MKIKRTLAATFVAGILATGVAAPALAGPVTRPTAAGIPTIGHRAPCKTALPKRLTIQCKTVASVPQKSTQPKCKTAWPGKLTTRCKTALPPRTLVR